MHTVIETPTFLSHCRRAGILDTEQHDAIVDAVAEDPRTGDIIQGTGGARKRRFAGRGKGKSGGYRVISYYAGDDVPVLLLVLIDKGERGDISKGEREVLRMELANYAESYRRFKACTNRDGQSY